MKGGRRYGRLHHWTLHEPPVIETALSLAEAKRLYDQAALLSGWGAWECHIATENLSWTDGVYDIFGLARGSTLRRAETVELYFDDSRKEMERRRAALIAHGTNFSFDAHIRSASGQERWMRLSAQVVHENGRPVRIFGAKQDVSQEKQLWTTLRELAFRDALTGLANRRAFEVELDQVARYGTEGMVAALAIVDLDHFKQINDRHGHAAGDACLREAALRLTERLKGAATIARLGGDEFAVLLRARSRREIATELSGALAGLTIPVMWQGRAINLGATIGVAIFAPGVAVDPAQLMAEADAALYLAKAQGRNRLHVFGQPFEPYRLERA